MSKKNSFQLLFLLLSLVFFACKHRQKTTTNKPSTVLNNIELTKSDITALVKKYPDENLILIKTPMGEMVARLFNETPAHRDNFIRLVEHKFYDSLLFHRVISDFMIQGGDPDSKKAKTGQKLGDGDIGYTVPAEFNNTLFHKKGMLCAAREGDDINPMKASSACQFYIVQGKKFTDESMKTVEYRVNRDIRTKLKNDLLEVDKNRYLKEEENRFKNEGKKDSLALTQKKIDALISPYYEKTAHYVFSERQRETYKTLGGTPHLDGSYTVYGEIVWGLPVIDKIATSQTDSNDRPMQDIRMSVSILKKH
ncbi:MAG: peptidylprolyl isomerase [Bacteroidetes bacterium]|jgi:cyclophilin family peptidyl-prolyl cis-trans isomerase|nr:peptidylprolyl isomerase [Bacteroidota bacterium]